MQGTTRFDAGWLSTLARGTSGWEQLYPAHPEGHTIVLKLIVAVVELNGVSENTEMYRSPLRGVVACSS
jgi:hypothetical protein